MKRFEHGYGFITIDGSVDDAFVHKTSVRPKGHVLQPGDRVSFEAKLGPKGMHAVNVELIKVAPGKGPTPGSSPQSKRSKKRGKGRNTAAMRASGAAASGLGSRARLAGMPIVVVSPKGVVERVVRPETRVVERLADTQAKAGTDRDSSYAAGGTFRDNGRFGSYPSEDDYSDESDPE